ASRQARCDCVPGFMLRPPSWSPTVTAVDARRDTMRRMKAWLIFAASIALAAQVHAQAPAAPPCDAPESHQLDFWLGDWQLAYAENGKPGTSRNRITKILGGCVVLEEFDGPPGTPLQGRSVSMYDRATARWKQTWVDNAGAYLDFTGGL